MRIINVVSMGLFFADKKPAAPGPGLSHPKSHLHGQVTPREFNRDVMGRLRQSGLSEHDRDIVRASAAGFLDKEVNGDIGMSVREKEEFVEHLGKERSLGLDQRDIDRIDQALDKSL